MSSLDAGGVHPESPRELLIDVPHILIRKRKMRIDRDTKATSIIRRPEPSRA